MTTRKKLIEVALPLEAINAASAREKSIRHGHPSTLHLWWARRPLAAARAVIFASLVDDPDDPNAPSEFVEACKKLTKGKNATENDTPRMRLFDFIEQLVTWESTTDEKVLNTARQLIQLATDGNPPPLLDPFAGGGSIPLEAQRLGLEAHASDLNPVAVMINKAQIEIPPRFANQPPVNPSDRAKMGGIAKWKGASGLAADIEYYGEWVREKALEKIGHLYPYYNNETVIAWLWARTIVCPNPACHSQIPLISSMWLSKKKGRKTWISPQVDLSAKKITFTVEQGKGKVPVPPKVGRGAKFRCYICEQIAPDEHVKEQGMKGEMGAQMIAIVTEGSNGRNYHSPNLEQEKIAFSAKPLWGPRGDVPERLTGGTCYGYGLTTWESLFTSRQLLGLNTFSDLLPEVRKQIQEDAKKSEMPHDDTFLRANGAGAVAYSEAISVYLSFAISRLSDRASSLASWDSSRDSIRNTFGRQAIPMVWDYAEVNPFSNSSGNWLQNISWISKVINELNPINSGVVKQVDAAKLDYSSIAVSTDPPYYDNISYADLSDYFYGWLRPNLRNIYPDVFGTMLVPKEPELIAAPYRFDGNKEAANEHFETGIMEAFHNIRKVIREEYPLTVYYAFKQQEIVVEEGAASTGWETMLNGLIDTGFQVVGTWPMRTELSNRMVATGTNALASSIVLVCRPRPENAPISTRRDFVNSLRQELPQAIKEMQSGNIAPVDLAQASIGPGMAVYSRYSNILEPNGQRLTVRTALQLINQVLDEHLAEQEGHLDADSRFAVAWFEQYGFNQGEFGTADVLARAKNTSVAGLVSAGIAESSAGKVRLIEWEELDPGWNPAEDNRPTVWEATHHLIERINVHGEDGAAMLLAKMKPALAADARQLAYRLYAICERKGWSAHARDYNGLVVSWSNSQEKATEFKQSYQQGKLL